MPLSGVLPSLDGSFVALLLPPLNARRITVSELESAINRARVAQPASGTESSLTREVATLGALYGRLIWERREAVEIDALSDAERVALSLWLPPA